MIQRARPSNRITNLSKSDRRFSPIRNGVVLIEMAIVLPVIILLLVIAIDLCRFLIVSSALSNAISQGINVGSATTVTTATTNTWKTTIENSILDSLHQYSWFSPNSLTFDIPTPSISNGLVNAQGFRSLKIALSYETDFIMRFPGLTQSYRINSEMQSDQIR